MPQRRHSSSCQLHMHNDKILYEFLWCFKLSLGIYFFGTLQFQDSTNQVDQDHDKMQDIFGA